MKKEKGKENLILLGIISTVVSIFFGLIATYQPFNQTKSVLGFPTGAAWASILFGIAAVICFMGAIKEKLQKR